MSATIIPHIARDEFEKIHGRPVQPIVGFDRLQKSDISVIPSKQFYEFLEQIFTFYLVNEKQLELSRQMVERSMINEAFRSHANSNNNDADIAELHDDILRGMDHHFGYLAYFMKINAFMPRVSQHFGGCFEYSFTEFSPGDNKTKHFYNAMIFDHLMDIPSIKATIQDESHKIFRDLMGLQSIMSDACLLDRMADTQRDEFCRQFLDNGEMELDFVADRIEWNFMRLYEFPLGILKTSPAVSKALADMRSDESYLVKVQESLSDGQFFKQYPGLRLRSGSKKETGNDDVKKSICRQGLGPFPSSGLVIG